MSVHVSRVEEVIKAEELLFEATPAFGEWKRLFPKKAVEFPAKANLNLVQFLIEEFTMKGDTVLDPMGGTGSTAVMASLQGRHGVIVELEKKYVEWALEAKRRTEATLGEKGEIKIIQGDSRELSKVLGMVDSIITSPPYADAKKGGEADEEAMAERWDSIKEREHWNTWGKTWKTEGRKRALKSLGSGYSEDKGNIGNLPVGKVDAIVTSPPYSEQNIRDISKEPYGSKRTGGMKRNITQVKPYSEAKDNIGNLPLGKVDSIITSPPYSDSFKHTPQNKEKRLEKLIEVDRKGVEKGQKWALTSKEALERRLAGQDNGYGSTKGNIGNFPTGSVDAIVTSPPYSENRTEMGGEKGKRGGDSKLRVKKDYVNPEEESNISRLPHGNIDAVITSPPYENQVHSASGGIRDKLSNYKVPGQLSMTYGYSIEKNNIGNLKRESYFDAMKQVYEESYKVLKPNGQIIVILKNFIRNKQVVDLVYDSYRLLEHMGFKLERVYKLRLKQESFWRILNRRKYPSTPKLAHEYVLVFRKP